MKGRKIAIITSLIIGGSIMLSGCSKEKTMVLDIDTKQDTNAGISLKEEIINLDLKNNESFTPYYFEGDEVYGSFGLISGPNEYTKEYPISGVYKKNLYTLDNKGNLLETKRTPAIYDWTSNLDIEGVAQEFVSNSIYKFNNKTGEKDKVGEFNSYDEEKVTGDYLTQVQTIEGNEEYAYIMENEEKAYNGIGEDKLLRLDIMNLKDNKKYTYKGDDVSTIADIVYSKITEKFYALDNTGRIYDVSLIGDEIKLKKEGKIDKKDLIVNGTYAVSINTNGEIVILNIYGNGETLAIVYNPKTKKSNYINKNEELYVGKYFRESNKVILAKQNENETSDIYFGEIESDSIKIYKKLDIKLENEEESIFSSAIMSEDGKKVLIETAISRKDNKDTDYRYQFNLLEMN